MTKKTLFIGRTPVGGFDESSEPDVCAYFIRIDSVNRSNSFCYRAIVVVFQR